MTWIALPELGGQEIARFAELMRVASSDA